MSDQTFKQALDELLYAGQHNIDSHDFWQSVIDAHAREVEAARREGFEAGSQVEEIICYPESMDAAYAAWRKEAGK